MSSHSRRPREEIGGACSQAPDSLELAAKSLAPEVWSLVAKRESKTDVTLGSSHAFWELGSAGVDTEAGRSLLQVSKAESFLK